MGKNKKGTPDAVLNVIAKAVKKKPVVKEVKPKSGHCPPNCGLHNH